MLFRALMLNEYKAGVSNSFEVEAGTDQVLLRGGRTNIEDVFSVH